MRRTAELAAAQGGIVDRIDLVAVGWSSSAIGRAVGTGLLHRRYLGVYAWGHGAPTERGRQLAAARAHGRDGRLSHRSAGALLALRPSARHAYDVTAPGGRPGTYADIDLHVARLPPEDCAEVDGVPCTSVARTLVDLGDVVDTRGVERAMEEALARGVFDLVALKTTARRQTGRPGAAVVLDLLAGWTGGTWTRSELEERLLALVDAAGLPRPRLNRHEAGAEVDAVWPAERVCVEVDSFRYHARRARFRSDRRKEVALEAEGWRLLRVLDEDLVGEPAVVAARIRAALCPTKS